MQRLASVLVLAALYAVLTFCLPLPNPPFASPREVLSFVLSSEFARIVGTDCLTTVWRTLACWLSGGAGGAAAGLLLVMMGGRSRLLVGALEFLRSIPSVMWVPFGIVLVGLGTKPVLLVAVVVVFLFMASEVAYSGHLLVPQRREHFRRLGLSWWNRIRFVHAYETAGVVIPSARVAVNIALIVVLISEMQAGARIGLGARLLIYQAGQRGEGIVSLMLLSGVLGLLLNMAMAHVEKRIVPWSRETRSRR